MTRHQRAFRSYWSDPGAPMSIGCLGCPDLSECGGQYVAGDGFYCLDNCCGAPETCDVVCPRNASDFVDRLREIRGFELCTPLAKPVACRTSAPYVPLIFHGSGRNRPLTAPAVALKLYQFFNQHADCRFTTRDDFCDAFKISSSSQIILSGVAQDREVERWWKLEREGRLKAISNLRRLGVSLVTSPNFSLMVDRPRWDDLHSMKRILEVHHEMVSEGQAAALHVNGRTWTDFERWSEYIFMHPEVAHIAYEFTTGARSPERMAQHVEWLSELARMCGRELTLILRGGFHAVPVLSEHFSVVYIDSSPFEKAMHREVASLDDSGKLS